MKPDKQIYQCLLKRYNLKPEECLFVDDLENNTKATSELGIHAFTFKIDRLDELKKKILG